MQIQNADDAYSYWRQMSEADKPVMKVELIHKLESIEPGLTFEIVIDVLKTLAEN